MLISAYSCGAGVPAMKQHKRPAGRGDGGPCISIKHEHEHLYLQLQLHLR